METGRSRFWRPTTSNLRDKELSRKNRRLNQRRQPRRRPEETAANRHWFIWTGIAATIAIIAVIAIVIVTSGSGDGDAPDGLRLTASQIDELTERGHVLGQSDAPVTLVEFGDFQ